MKLVSEASNAVVGEAKRDGFINSRIERGKTVPTLDSNGHPVHD